MRELTLHSIVKSKNKNLPGEDGFELSRASPGGMDLICLTPPHYTLVRPPPWVVWRAFCDSEKNTFLDMFDMYFTTFVISDKHLHIFSQN
jgi:hypothetical protein